MKRNKVRILPARPSSGGGYLDKDNNLEFERLNKTKRKKLIIAGILGLGIIIGGISLYRSYALYEEEKEYNVLKGQIPNFGYDVKFAVTVDGEKSTEIPNRQKSDSSYYKVKVSCENGTTIGEWDYNAWNVKLDDISDGSKCTLAFTGGMSKEDYQKYIEEGIVTRRNTYRGKDLTDFFNKHKEEFYKQISEGTFDDIYVGDYIIDKNHVDVNNKNIVWLVADIDNYMGAGYQKAVNQHHLTIIPKSSLKKSKMNSNITSQYGYYGSLMVSGLDDKCSVIRGNKQCYQEVTSESVLNKVLSDYITCSNCSFKDHVITYDSVLINSTNSTNDGSPLSGEGAWFTRQIDLMSEVNVYGTIMSTQNFAHKAGLDIPQYAIFRLNPSLIVSEDDRASETGYWLKGDGGSGLFSAVAFWRGSGLLPATEELGVRPRFLIG